MPLKKEESYRVNTIKNGFVLETTWYEPLEGQDDKYNNEEVYYKDAKELCDVLQNKLENLV